MDQETARQLFYHGSFFIFLDFPVGSEFGIDYKSWITGEKFKGVKMIPPGIHFIYFSVHKQSNQSPRIGFFHNFEAKEILVKKWDSSAEDFMDYVASDEEIERYRSNLTELDQFLAPYPYEHSKTWFSLTDNITPAVVDKLRPLDHGRISSQSDLISKEVRDLGESSQKVDRGHPIRQRFFDKQGLPIMYLKPGREIRFTDLKLADAAPVDPASSPSDELLGKILASCQRDEDFLGEMQFAFVTFLVGHLYAGFEQWKRIVRLLCSCKSLTGAKPQFYCKFVAAIYFQLKLTPTDFFVDIVSKNNFLTLTLTNFFTNVECNADSAELCEKAAKFKNYLQKFYKWNFDEAAGEDSDPVVVDT